MIFHSSLEHLQGSVKSSENRERSLGTLRILCWRHTVPKLTQDGNTVTEIFTFGSDRENIAPFVRAS